MITYVKVDLLEDSAEALVNTVNTVGVMGKGIALQFKKRYPAMFHHYRTACARGKVKIGKMFVYEHHDLNGKRIIINFPTKIHWQESSAYKFIIAGLMDLVDVIVKRDIKSIAIPPLGCGNGNLMWVNVKKMMEEQLSAMPIDIRIYEPENVT
jgi:O-acetyl-ADP-ribose deacetylase (regulator of RNase III)